MKIKEALKQVQTTAQTKSRPSFVTPDNIVNISVGDGLDDSMIHAVDEFGAETLRLRFRVIERATRKPRYARLQFPLDQEYVDFQREVMEWMSMGHAIAPTLIVPEVADIDSSEGIQDLFVKLVRPMMHYQPARQKGMDIVFRYLAPYIEDGDTLEGEGTLLEKSHIYLRGNATIKIATDMMVAALRVEDYIKKNETYQLMSLFQGVIQPSSTAVLQKPDDAQLMRFNGRRSRGTGFGFDA